MTDNANTQDLGSLESRIAGVQRDLAAAAATAARRRVVAAVILLIIIIAMIIYLSVAFSYLKRDATIENLSYIAESKLDEVIADQSQKLIARAKEMAPEVGQTIEKRALEAPAQLAQELRARAKEGLKEQIATVEPQLVEGLKELIERVYAEAGGADGKPMDESEWQAFLADAGEVTVEQTLKAIAQARELYLTGGKLGAGARNILNYFELLAGDPAKLTERQQHHRKIITHVLMLMEKYRQEAGGE